MEASQVGFGTYQLKGKACYDAVKWAIEGGYKLIDSATVYRNEEQIGNVLQDLKIQQSEIFITSKLGPNDQGYDSCIAAVDKSLSNLKLSVIDQYLIHWPGVGKTDPSSTENYKLRTDSYRALEQCVNDKKLRFIGVSNFNLKHLNQVLENSDIKPYLIQNECHPLYYDEELINYCKENKIKYQAYSSFGSSGTGNLVDQFSDYFLGNHLDLITKRHSKSLPQVLLKWALQNDLYVIPKASSKDHILENFALDFTLTDLEMDKIDHLRDELGMNKFCWDPKVVN